MLEIALLTDVPAACTPLARLLLAHGAGAGMDSAFMTDIAALLSARGIAVSRFEFAYMAQRRIDGRRRPPPRVEVLQGEFIAAVAACRAQAAHAALPLLIGGKSMGGRIATLVAPPLFASGAIAGVVCLGYPFHPAGKPQSLRTDHLVDYVVPTLVIQGERDALGARAEVAAYPLSRTIEFSWAIDGDHDLAPRAGRGTTHLANLEAAADAIVGFATRRVA